MNINVRGGNISMTLDKFGRHIHGHHSGEYKLCLVEDISNLNYYAMIYIIALNSDEHGYYRIVNSENFEYEYKLPTATVTNVKWTPGNIKIYINNTLVANSSLYGLTLNTGDKISIQTNKNSKVLFALEAVLQIPFIRS